MCTMYDSLETSSNVWVDLFDALFWTHSVIDLNCIHFVVLPDSSFIHVAFCKFGLSNEIDLVVF